MMLCFLRASCSSLHLEYTEALEVLVQTPAQSFTGRSGFSGPCSGTFYMSPRMEISQFPWAVGLLHQVG